MKNEKLFLKRSLDNKYILISDLYIATYLICKGVVNDGVKRSATEPTRVYFLFQIEKLSDVINSVKEFLSGVGTVRANDFSAELKKQKSLVKGVIESDSQDTIDFKVGIMIDGKEVFEIEPKKES